MFWHKLIISFSKETRRVINDLQDGRSDKFYEHVLKILVKPNGQEVNHWSEEMYNLCSWIQRTTIKPNKKPISKELMIDNFFDFGETLELFSSALDNMYSDYNNTERKDKSKDQELYNKYKQFCNAVADTLVERRLNKATMKSLVDTYLL